MNRTTIKNMKCKLAACLGIALAAGVASAADIVQEDGTNTTGNITIDVAAGDTFTINGKVTGSGGITKTGDGVLILTNGENDWTGRLTLKGGKVQADAEGALSTAQMYVGVDGTSNPGPWFVLNAEGATFHNTFTRNNKHGYLIWFLKSATVAGNLTVESSCSPRLYVAEGATATFEGSVSGSNTKQYYNYGAGTLVFNGKMAMGGVSFSNNTTGRTMRFGCCENVFGSFDMYGGMIYCDAANVLNGAQLKNSSGTVNATLDLNGFDQTVASFVNVSGKLTGTVKTPDEKPAALTIATDCTCSYTLSGPLSLVVDCGAESTCAFTKKSPMTGGVTVKSGTFSAAAASAFTGISSLAVSNGAHAVVQARDTAVFKEGLELTLEEGAELALSGPQLTVSKLTYKGKTLRCGTYDSTTCPAITSGAVYVDRTQTETVTWMGAGEDTNVTTAANWSTSPNLPNFDGCDLAATFAEGGTAATLDHDVSFASLAFTVPEFTFNGAKTMTLVDTTVTFSETAAESRAYRFDAPWCIAGNLTMTPPSATAVYLKGNVTAPADATAGTISFHGENGACLWLDGVTIEQNVWEKTGGGESKFALRSVAGTTNVISGTLTTANESTHCVWLVKDSELTVKGGLTMGNGAIFMGEGTLVAEGPILCNAKKDLTVNASSGGDGEKLTFVFAASGGTGSTVSFCKYGGNADFRTDNAFGASTAFEASARGNGHTCVRLNDTVQTFKSFAVMRTTDYTYSGPLEVLGSGGRLVAATGDSCFKGASDSKRLKVTGDVTLENAGTGTLEIGYLDQNGKLSVALTGGSSMLKVLDGECVKVEALTVDGVTMPAGRYAYATAPAALKARMVETTGTLRVGRLGTIIKIY